MLLLCTDISSKRSGTVVLPSNFDLFVKLCLTNFQQNCLGVQITLWKVYNLNIRNVLYCGFFCDEHVTCKICTFLEVGGIFFESINIFQICFFSSPFYSKQSICCLTPASCITRCGLEPTGWLSKTVSSSRIFWPFISPAEFGPQNILR